MSILTLVIVVDAVVSTVKVKNIKGTLEHIEKLNKEIKDRMKEIKQLSIEKNKEKEINVNALVEKLKKKRNRIILRLYRRVHRLKKAFPAIETKEITQVLNQKLEFIKKNKNT